MSFLLTLPLVRVFGVSRQSHRYLRFSRRIFGKIGLSLPSPTFRHKYQGRTQPHCQWGDHSAFIRRYKHAVFIATLWSDVTIISEYPKASATHSQCPLLKAGTNRSAPAFPNQHWVPFYSNTPDTNCVFSRAQIARSYSSIQERIGP